MRIFLSNLISVLRFYLAGLIIIMGLSFVMIPAIVFFCLPIMLPMILIDGWTLLITLPIMITIGAALGKDKRIDDWFTQYMSNVEEIAYWVEG